MKILVSHRQRFDFELQNLHNTNAMCTVSYIPTQQGFILTSSRDELKSRPTIKPELYKENDLCLIYPKDLKSGGTWIASSDNGKIACLLNGGFKDHSKKEIYARSRGSVLLEWFDYKDTIQFINKVNLTGVEPFTLLLIEHVNSLQICQLVWDEEQLHVSTIDTDKPHIWSSSTLYNEEAKQVRMNWFTRWLDQYNDEPDINILSFHLQKHNSNELIDIIMNRPNGLQTVSVTQLNVQFNNSKFIYFDFIKKEKTELEFNNIQNEFYA